jgi:hypothetical protein
MPRSSALSVRGKDLPPGLCIPHPHRGVSAPRGDALAVGAERHAGVPSSVKTPPPAPGRPRCLRPLGDGGASVGDFSWVQVPRTFQPLLSRRLDPETLWRFCGGKIGLQDTDGPSLALTEPAEPSILSAVAANANRRQAGVQRIPPSPLTWNWSFQVSDWEGLVIANLIGTVN